MKNLITFEEFLNESQLNEARAVSVTVTPEMFGKTLQKFYKVKGETNTWRVHSEYYNDQTQANNSSDRDVIYFEAMAFPTGKIIVGAGLINNLTGNNAGTLGKTFGTTVDEFKADPKKVCKEAADLILSKDQQKIFSKLAKSQGQTFRFKLDGDFSSVIEELIDNSLK
jgi:hypothetical protein